MLAGKNFIAMAEQARAALASGRPLAARHTAELFGEKEQP